MATLSGKRKEEYIRLGCMLMLIMFVILADFIAVALKVHAYNTSIEIVAHAGPRDHNIYRGCRRRRSWRQLCVMWLARSRNHDTVDQI